MKFRKREKYEAIEYSYSKGRCVVIDTDDDLYTLMARHGFVQEEEKPEVENNVIDDILESIVKYLE